MTIDGDVSYDVIIPVVSTLILAIVGYFMQFIAFVYNSKQEGQKTKIDAYSKFYLKLIINLNVLVSTYMKYKAQNNGGTWRKFGDFLLTNASATDISIENKHIIQQFSSISAELSKMYREDEYYPLSKCIHRKNMKLCIFIETFLQMEKNSIINKEYCDKIKKNVKLPNIQMMIKMIFFAVR